MIVYFDDQMVAQTAKEVLMHYLVHSAFDHNDEYVTEICHAMVSLDKAIREAEKKAEEMGRKHDVD